MTEFFREIDSPERHLIVFYLVNYLTMPTFKQLSNNILVKYVSQRADFLSYAREQKMHALE